MYEDIDKKRFETEGRRRRRGRRTVPEVIVPEIVRSASLGIMVAASETAGGAGAGA